MFAYGSGLRGSNLGSMVLDNWGYPNLDSTNFHRGMQTTQQDFTYRGEPNFVKQYVICTIIDPCNNSLGFPENWFFKHAFKALVSG